MKHEQIIELLAMQERLIDIFLKEGQEEKWPDMDTKEGRGDRVWYKKNAFATLQIAGKIQSVLLNEASWRNAGKGGDGEADLDEENEREAQEAEAEAKKVLKRYGLKT